MDIPIHTFNNFITMEECDNHITNINNKKNKICFTTQGRFESDKYIDNNLANYFFSKIPDHIIHKYNMIKPNKLIMTGKYNTNQEFGIHTDTGLYYSNENNCHSKYTLLIYLNDDFSGGETIFYDEQLIHHKTIIPKKGMALLFDLSLWHKGGKIINGTKYWVGCEIIAPI